MSNHSCCTIDPRSRLPHHQGPPAAQDERVLCALLAALHLRSQGTADHCRRLSRYASATARELGCSEHEVELVRQAALVHDIGKIGIPDAILLKPGSLSGEEFDTMSAHVTMGRHLLLQLGEEFAELAEIVGAHHERWDGRGYPLGLSGEGIPLGARVLAVVDAFDSMTDASRPYQQARSATAAMEELCRGKGTHFDARVVDAFLRVDETLLSA